MISEQKREELKFINSQLNDSAIVFGSEAISYGKIQTGIFNVDKALLGGYFEGKFNLLHGASHGGKSTIAYSSISEFQKKYPNKFALLIDTEGAFPRPEEDDKGVLTSWATQLNIDLDRLLILSTTLAEDIGDVIGAWSGVQAKDSHIDVGMIVLDSLAMVTSKKELDKATGEIIVGGTAKVVSQFLTLYISNQAKREASGLMPVTFLCINQHRDNIGGFGVSLPTLPKGKTQKYIATGETEFIPLSINKDKMTDTTSENGLVHRSKHRMRVRKYRGGGYEDDTWFYLQTVYEGYHPNKANPKALSSLLKKASQYGVIEVYNVEKEKFIKLKGLELEIQATSIVETLQLDESLIDYIAACIIMIDRLRSSKAPLPVDKYIYQHFDVAPPFVYEEAKRLGKHQLSTRMKNKEVNEVLKGL